MHLEHRILITGVAGFIGSALCRHLFLARASTAFNREGTPPL